MTQADRAPTVSPWLTLAAICAGWALLFGSILAIRAASTVTEYEPDIYAVLPTPSLVALIAAVGCFCVAAGANRSTLVGRIGVVSGLTGIMLVAATWSYAPWLRGYEYYGRADLATHFGAIETIAGSGSVSQQDFYPGARVVGGIIEISTGLGPAGTFLIGRIVMTVVFIAGSVSLARIAMGTKRWDVLVAAAAALPVAGAYAPSIVPAEFAAALSPALIACLVLRARGKAPGLVAIALAICIAISHPLIALVDIMVLASWVALSALPARLGLASADANTPRPTSVALVAAAYIAWITPFAVFRNQLLQVRDAVVGEATGSLTRLLDLAGLAGFGVIDSARLAIQMNIGVLPVLIIAFPAALSILIGRRPWPGSRTAVATIVVLLLSLGTLTLITAVALSQLDLFRFVQITGMVLPVCAGIAAAVLMVKHARLALASIAGLFAVSLPFLVASPTLFSPSMHVPPNELAGIHWTARASRGGDVPMGYVASAKPLIGYVAPDPDDPLRDPILSSIRMPDHFSTATGNQGLSGRLLVPLSDMERYAYGTLWASADRFTTADFARLDADPTVSKPYAASRIDVYLLGAVP